jgi:hypothetical protein
VNYSSSAAGPSLALLQTAVAAFGRYTTAEDSWTAFLTATAPGVDPSLPGHRTALLRWLNAAGCRIRYPRTGEPDLFGTGVTCWWEEYGELLPAAEERLVGLDDERITAVGAAFAALSAAPASLGRRPRPLGPTAASKLLHALRPYAVMPWDAAIAAALHRTRDGSAFAAHQRLGRAWGRAVLAEAGGPATDTTNADAECELAAAFGTPGRPLAKMLDDYCYLVFTAGSVEPETDGTGSAGEAAVVPAIG